MRVLYLAPWSHHRGLLSRRSFLDEEIRALAASGIDAYVLSPSAERDIDDGHLHVRAVPRSTAADRRLTMAFLARHLGHVPLANASDPAQFFRAVDIERAAAQVVERDDLDVVHSYFGWPRGFGGMLVKAATGRPLVAALRGADVNVLPEYRYGSRLNASFDRAFLRLLRVADITVSVSEFLRERAVTLGAPAERARVILKGVRLDQFGTALSRDAARARLGLPQHPIVLAVCGLVAIKGVDDLLAGLAILTLSHRFSFVVCGTGPEREALQKFAVRFGMADRTIFRGAVSREEIAQQFAAADIFVQGSRIEASGNALLEAMASGLPIVCTDAGGPREYVDHGRTGFVVPVGNTPMIAERVRMLLDDPLARESFGRRGRDRAELHFSYRRMIADTHRVYDEVLGAGRVSARASGASMVTA